MQFFVLVQSTSRSTRQTLIDTSGCHVLPFCQRLVLFQHWFPLHELPNLFLHKCTQIESNSYFQVIFQEKQGTIIDPITRLGSKGPNQLGRQKLFPVLITQGTWPSIKTISLFREGKAHKGYFREDPKIAGGCHFCIVLSFNHEIGEITCLSCTGMYKCRSTV